MPAIIPFIPLIAAGVTAGTHLGLTLSNEPSGPSAPTPTTTTPTAQAPGVAQIAQAQQTIPNILGNTSGFASPGMVQQEAGVASGLGSSTQGQSALQAMVNQYFGLAAPGQTGFSGIPATNTVASLSGSPGVTGASPLTGGGGGSSIVDNLLNQQDFKAFS